MFIMQLVKGIRHGPALVQGIHDVLL
jgi:hypothetical protein